MTYPLILRPEAEEDLLDAYRWYDERVSDLGLRFLALVERILTQVENNPQAFAEVHEGVRRALIRTFPYGIYFSLKAKESSFSLSSIHRVTPACGWSEHVLPPKGAAADGQPATRLVRS